MRKQHNKGFTLVELLVVIGIIALLISILLPSLNKARKSAQAVACASNMRQLGQAFTMYAGANGGFLPYACYNPGAVNNPSWTWDDLLSRYLGLKFTDSQINYVLEAGPSTPGGASPTYPVLRCPADDYARVWGGTRNATPRSYAMNCGYPNYPNIVSGMADAWYGAGAPTRRLSFKLGEAKLPTETILLAEFAADYNIAGALNGSGIFVFSVQETPAPPGYAHFTPQLHGGRYNYLMADGHVEMLALKQTFADGVVSTLPSGMWMRRR